MCFKIAARHQFKGGVPPSGICEDTLAMDIQYSLSSLRLQWALAEVVTMACNERQKAVWVSPGRLFDHLAMERHCSQPLSFRFYLSISHLAFVSAIANQSMQPP